MEALALQPERDIRDARDCSPSGAYKGTGHMGTLHSVGCALYLQAYNKTVCSSIIFSPL